MKINLDKLVNNYFLYSYGCAFLSGASIIRTIDAFKDTEYKDASLYLTLTILSGIVSYLSYRRTQK